jgi:hypothetical protein
MTGSIKREYILDHESFQPVVMRMAVGRGTAAPGTAVEEWLQDPATNTKAGANPNRQKREIFIEIELYRLPPLTDRSTASFRVARTYKRLEFLWQFGPRQKGIGYSICKAARSSE